MPSSFRYPAFISYCHRDRKSAARLQAAVENFRLPREAGDLPERLRPVFRDREVLGSSHDLSAAICTALDESAHLLVVCSPQAAASRWVAAEIRHFIERRGLENVLCFIVDGVPNAADPAHECLPEPLRSAQSGREVLAADARPQADGWNDAVLKTIAGLTGLPFVALARREQARLRRRALAWAATGLLLAALFGSLAVYSARNAAAAKKAAKSAELIAGYLEEVLGQFRPRGDDNTARAALLPFIDASTSAERLRQLEDEPAALLRVRDILGRAYLELNAADRALPLVEANAALAAATFGPDDPRLDSIERAYGNTLNALGQHERAAEIHRRIIDRVVRRDGERSEEALAAMTNLAMSLDAAGRKEEGNALRVRVYELGHGFFPDDHPGFQISRRNYAICLAEQGKYQEALSILEKLRRDQLASLGAEHLGTAETNMLLAMGYEDAGRHQLAAEARAAAAESFARIHGPDNDRALRCALALIYNLTVLGRQDEVAAATKQYFGHPPDPRKLAIIGKTPADLSPEVLLNQ